MEASPWGAGVRRLDHRRVWPPVDTRPPGRQLASRYRGTRASQRSRGRMRLRTRRKETLGPGLHESY